ncbi:MAG TPA: TetR/AcrR family transcriptional regulator [Caulobacteraceae bacterium]|nr:TetR/AcrR family transcriptional regulator [Caulobacteraceae bacterium]
MTAHDAAAEIAADEPLGRAERKRRVILEAASQLFLRQGFPGASMDEVVALASVSKQTLYKHFAHKQALFVGVVESMTGEASGRVQAAMIEPDDPAQVSAQLQAHAHRLLDIVLTPRLLQLRRLVIGEASRFPELGRALYDGGPGRSIALLAATFARWAERGWLTVDDPMMAASHFNWLIMAEPINRAMFCGDDPFLDAAERNAHVFGGVRVFLAAYGAGPIETDA